MVQQLPRPTANLAQSGDFPVTAPAANPVFYRTYSRKQAAGRESWSQVADRTVAGITTLGNLTPGESALISRMQREVKSLTSGRWLWIGGTDWIAQAKNFSGAYNCTSTNVVDWRAFGLMMDLAMMGCGTGAMLEPRYLDRLPSIRNELTVTLRGALGVLPAIERQELTQVSFDGNQVTIAVGDSRHGWVASYQTLLELSSDPRFDGPVSVIVDLSNVRPAGEALQGFGGIANPVRLPDLYQRCATILNRAIGRQLTSVECCLLIDEAAVTIVAGNVRRCLPENALVHTDHGLVPIKDIQVGDRVQTPIGFRAVVNKFDQGFQDVYEIETNGPTPRATLNHRIAVYADAMGTVEWKPVGELQSGDRLMHNKMILPGTITQLPPDCTADRPVNSRTAKSFSVPTLGPEVAWLIGFTHGDGYVALGRNKHDKPFGNVTWAMNGTQVELTQHLQQKIDAGLSCFGLQASHGMVKGENTAKSICSSIRLAEYFHTYIKRPKESLVIPDFILQGTVDVRAAYLAGLMDSDGSVNNRPPHLVVTVYRDFARQVAALLSSLGIAARISVTRPEVSNWQVKYNLMLPALKDRYNALIALHSAKGSLRIGQKTYGFTLAGEMMREAYSYSEMRGMGFQGAKSVDSNYERYVDESDLNLDIPVTVQGLGGHDHVQTYDIEVEEAHCFYCDGYLTHNSAGMRQFDSGDEAAAIAKDNLWQQDAEGNWRIDPERDSLRMANHTRVFHHKPTMQDCVDAVTKQFYSGEGAIQYAPEAIARSNADLLTTPELKREFLAIYTEQGRDAQAWLLTQKPAMTPEEVEHRLQRYALNPCITADSWVHTESGARQVKDLVGQQHGTYINGELFSTTTEGFFESGVKDVVKLTTQEGYSLRLTGNHRLLKVIAQTQQAQYTDWVETAELQPGDRVLIHNHRGLQPWAGAGTAEEGWLLGSLIGDGCFSVSEKNYLYQANLRFWGETKVEMKEYALALANGLSSSAPKPLIGTYHDRNQYFQVSSSPLAKLAQQFGVVQGHKTITPAIEKASHEFYCGFLRGLFDADGSVQGNQTKGVSVRLSQSNAPLLEAVQRMLLRLGISSAIYRNRRPEQVRLLPDSDRNLAEYACKAQHELVISNDNLPVFLETIGFREPQKQAQLTQLLGGYKRNLNRDRFAVTVAEITPDGTEMVYDCTVPGIARFDANGFVAHNCGEILGADFHCVAGETFLIAKDGLHQIKNVVGQPIEIWNGESWSEVTPIVTGRDRQLYRVQFGDGTFLDVTDQHRFFVADRFSTAYQELTTAELRDRLATHPYSLHTEPFAIDYQSGDYIDPTWAYTLGQLVGDGSLCQSHGKPQLQLRLYGEKSYKELTLAGRTSGTERYYAANKELPCLLYTGFHTNFDPEMVRALKYSAEAFDPIARWSRESILHFVAGLADADGSAVASGGIRLYLSDYDRAYRVYLLLLKCGVRSSVNLVQKAGTITNLGQRSKDLWYLQITDCAAIPCQRLDTHLGHPPTTKGKWQVIRSITDLPGVQDTYCFNEPVHHKGVFGGTLTGQCNLAEVHLNRLDPKDLEDQAAAFKAGALSVAALLNHQFQEDRYRQSREWDPIVGVSFTGLFDFFVHAFGLPWLDWWTAGRPDTVEGLEFKRKEAEYLDRWREIVYQTVWDYCDRHGLRRPNRCTTVQPSGTKSLLTGASPGWHPPKAARFLRRITFRKNDPVALACLDFGYSVIPSQSDKDDNGNLLDDPFDPRCTEWLVEIPTEVSWASIPGADQVDISRFSALAQFDFYMQVQRHYTRHNTSATIEFREAEIQGLAEQIYQTIANDGGYISAALLARFDDLQTFPRLPFEPIDQATYTRLRSEVTARQKTSDFFAALQQYDSGLLVEAGPAGCDSDKCMLPEKKGS
jgi:ribonucleotide reductase, class II